MNPRIQSILGWCDQRGILQITSFFRGCSNDQAMYNENYARIQKVMSGRPTQVMDSDEQWISDMENTINKLK